jgi:hypothetical protein
VRVLSVESLILGKQINDFALTIVELQCA